MKLAIFSTDFRKKKKAQISSFIKIRPVGAVVPCGRTEGHDEASSRFSQFCERA